MVSNSLPAGMLAELEAAIDRFEEAWQVGNCPPIRTFCGSEEPLASAVLRELVLVDFEHRLRAHQPRTVNEYLREFPELRSDESLISSLFKLQSRWKTSAETQAPLHESSSTGDPGQEETRRAQAPESTLAPSPQSMDKNAAIGGSHLQPSEPAKRVDTDFGPYQILDENIGRGSFGTVHRAFDTKLGRVVAIKVPRREILETELDRERFFREAQLAASLDHPNIVRVYEIGGTSEEPFIVSKFIDGCTLEKELANRRFGFRESAAVVRTLADALHYAHEKGMTHRDVKPSNIMLDGEGMPILMDFGMARRDGDPVLTQDGQLLGTPAYMSPEQAAAGATLVDARSDVYSLGVVLYEMLCGERPFRGSLQSVLDQVAHVQPGSLTRIDPNIPRDLAEICLKCLHKEPSDRYPNAAELRADLVRFLHGEPVHARPISLLARGWRWARKRPKTTLGIAAGLLIAASLLVCVSLSVHRARLKRMEDRANQFAAEGITLFGTGDKNKAIAHFAAALKLSSDPDRHSIHRTRLVSSLEQIPKPAGIWGSFASLSSIACSPTERLLAAASTHPARVILYRFDDFSRSEIQPALAAIPAICLFTPDGNHLAVSCSNGDLAIWDAHHWDHAPTVLKQGEGPSGLTIDPTSRLIASASQGDGVKIADLTSGAWIRTVLRAPASINDLAYNFDGSLLAMAGEDGTVRLWDVTSNQLRADSFKHDNPVNKVRFSPDGRLLISGCSNGLLGIWNVETGQQDKQFKLGSPVAQFAVQSGGSLLAVGCDDGRLCILNLKSLKLLPGEEQHHDKIRFLEFASQGRTLITASNDYTARLWDTATGRPVCPQVLDASILLWAQSNEDDQRILTADNQAFFRRWDLLPAFRAETRSQGSGNVERVEISGDGKWMLLTHSRGPLQLYDLDQKKLAAAKIGRDFRVNRGAISPDERYLVTSSNGENLELWNTRSQERVRELPRIATAAANLHWSPDCRLIVVCGEDGNAHVVSMTEKNELFLVKHGIDLKDAFFDHDCQKLYTVGTRSIAIWDATTKKLIDRRENLSEIESSQLTLDENSLLLRTEKAVFYDLKTREFRLPMKHSSRVTHTALSRDGKWVLTTSGDKSARIWSAATGEYISLTHSLGVIWGAFRDDNLVVATAADTTARVWDARTGEPASPPLVHPAPVVFVGFRNQGKELVTVTNDGVIRKWTLDDDSSKHDLLLRARMACGQEIDEHDSLRPLKSSEIKSAWDELNGVTQPAAH